MDSTSACVAVMWRNSMVSMESRNRSRCRISGTPAVSSSTLLLLVAHLERDGDQDRQAPWDRQANDRGEAAYCWRRSSNSTYSSTCGRTRRAMSAASEYSSSLPGIGRSWRTDSSWLVSTSRMRNRCVPTTVMSMRPSGKCSTLEILGRRAHLVRYGRTAGLAALLDQHDAKFALLVDTVVDHLAVTRLEDVQRQDHARKEDRVEREEGHLCRHRLLNTSLAATGI